MALNGIFVFCGYFCNLFYAFIFPVEKDHGEGPLVGQVLDGLPEIIV